MKISNTHDCIGRRHSTLALHIGSDKVPNIRLNSRRANHSGCRYSLAHSVPWASKWLKQLPGSQDWY